jgi:hypothetical protein
MRKSRLEINLKIKKIKQFALCFFFCTVFHFWEIALLLANQNWEIFHVHF